MSVKRCLKFPWSPLSNFWVKEEKKEYFYKDARDSSKYLYDANKQTEEED